MTMSPYYNKDSIVYHKGKFVSPDQIACDMYSQSIHYGISVFEGIRAYNTEHGTKIYKAKAHYERLKLGADLMHMNFKYPIKELVDITYELLARNNLKDAYIRPVVTTGANMSLVTSSEAFLTIQCWAWEKYMGNTLLRVKTSKYQRPNPKSCYVQAKVTGHYVNSVLSTNEAKQSHYDEAILLDLNGNIAEGSGANVFMEKDGQLFTPPKGHIMPGITRATIMEICRDENINVVEKHFTMEEFKRADSAFFTGTAAEVIGMDSIDDLKFPKPWEQTLGHKLMYLYKDEVLGKRIKALSKTA